jgi:hypothetical protein
MSLSILDTICWTEPLRTYLWGLYPRTEIVCKGFEVVIYSMCEQVSREGTEFCQPGGDPGDLAEVSSREAGVLSPCANRASFEEVEGFRTHGQWIHSFTLRGITFRRIRSCPGIGIDDFD